MDACNGHNLARRRCSDEFEDDWDLESFTTPPASSEDHSNSAPDTITTTYNIPEGPTNTNASPSTQEHPGDCQQETTATGCDPSNNAMFEDDPCPRWAPFLEKPYSYSPALGFHAYTAHWLEYGKPGVMAYPELLLEGKGYTSTWQAVKRHRGWKNSECMLYCNSPLRNEVKYEEIEEDFVTVDRMSHYLGYGPEVMPEEELSTTPPGSPLHPPIYEQSTTPPGSPPSFFISGQYAADILKTYQKNEEMIYNTLRRSPTIKFTCKDELKDHPVDDREVNLPIDAIMNTPKGALSNKNGASKRVKSFLVYKDDENVTTGPRTEDKQKRAKSFFVYRDNDSLA